MNPTKLQVQSTSKPKQRLAAPAAQAGRGRRRRKSKSGVVGPNKALPPFVQLMVNPTTAALDLSHPPDAATVPSLMWRTVEATNPVVDGQGNFLVEYRPGAYQGTNGHTIAATSPYAVTTVGSPSNWTDYTTLASSFSSYRPIALVVEMEYIGQLDAAKGVLYACVSDQATSVGLSQTQLLDEPYYVEASITAGEKLAVICRYSLSNNFTAIGSAFVATGTPRILAGMLRGPTTQGDCIRVRTTLVAEYLSSAGSLLQTHSAYTPSHHAAVSTAECLVGPAVCVAHGDHPYEQIIKKADTLARMGAKLNGLWEGGGKDVAAMVARMAAFSASRNTANYYLGAEL